ncbi:MAG: hypothetical protein R3E66_16170 [bacterium]
MTAIASHSALAGLCPLIPIPFVDDFIIVRIHRRLCRVLLKQHAIELSDAGARTLTHSPSNLLGGIVRKLVFWPIKKLITKLVYVLAVKSCADVAATVFNEGWLLARAIEQEYVPMDLVQRGDYSTLRDLRNAILKAREAVDPSPTQAVMRSAFSVGRGVFAATLSSLRGVLGGTDKNDERLEAAEKEVAPITQRIQEEIVSHWLSGPVLDAELRKALNPQSQIT